MSGLLRRTLYAVVAGALLYAAAMLYFDASAIAAQLADYPWWRFIAALALSSLNYLLRFAKWELALGWLAVRAQAPGLTRTRSLVIYLAGLSMSISPGKLGEVLRSALLKASDGVAFSRTAPIVVADRLTDLVALVVISLVGVSQLASVLPIVLATAVLVVTGVVVLGSPSISRPLLRRAARLPVVGRFAARAELLVDSAAVVLRLGPLAILSGISIVGWGLECVGFWLVLNGFTGVDASPSTAAFLWCTSTLVGALSFLPGGLFAAEGSLALATVRWVAGATTQIALAATMLGRAATLWYGELVGGVALAVFLRDPALRARAFAAEPEHAEPPSSSSSSS